MPKQDIGTWLQEHWPQAIGIEKTHINQLREYPGAVAMPDGTVRVFSPDNVRLLHLAEVESRRHSLSRFPAAAFPHPQED